MKKKKPNWGVKWELAGIGAGIFLSAGILAAILFFSFNIIHIWLLAVAFTGFLVLLWGLMGEGAKW